MTDYNATKERGYLNAMLSALPDDAETGDVIRTMMAFMTSVTMSAAVAENSLAPLQELRSMFSVVVDGAMEMLVDDMTQVRH
jgi:hypothetical protein